MTKAAKVKVQHWRGYVVIALLMMMFLALVGRVLSLQVLDTGRGVEFLKKQGDMRMLRTAELPEIGRAHV